MDGIAQQGRDAAHVASVVGLAVERLVYCSDGLFFPTAEEADVVEDLFRVLVVAEDRSILPDVDHVEGVDTVVRVNAHAAADVLQDEDDARAELVRRRNDGVQAARLLVHVTVVL